MLKSYLNNTSHYNHRLIYHKEISLVSHELIDANHDFIKHAVISEDEAIRISNQFVYLKIPHASILMDSSIQGKMTLFKYDGLNIRKIIVELSYVKDTINCIDVMLKMADKNAIVEFKLMELI